MSTHFNATFFLVNLAPIVITLALLCSLLNFAVLTLLHKADLIFLCLFAVISIPTPEPQIKTPIFLLHNIKKPFFDTMPENSISLLNLNTINDFSKKIDTEIEFERFRGNIYVTGPDGFWVFGPDGERLGVLEMPEHSANLNWGGANWDDLYCCCSTSVYRISMRVSGNKLLYMG